MEEFIRAQLNTNVLKRIGRESGGCISSGSAYQTDNRKIFVKQNSKPKADVMFQGEFESLKEIRSTDTVKVPEPLLLGKIKTNCFLVMGYFDLKSLNKTAELGKALANLHLHNINKIKQENDGRVGSASNSIKKFGFHTTTCCGYLPLDNEWCDDWVMFYTNQRLGDQISRIQREKNDREIGELWSRLQLKIPTLFKGLEIYPSLLHGDLWSGNAGEADGEPVIFDPAAFYGHHEFDLAIAKMFGGFGSDFFNAYHSVIPKAPGFKQREDLYLLFHHLNHWNHFGSSYRSSSLSIMKTLLNE